MELVKAKSLKVGDIVCDCRYKHLKIKSVIQQHKYGADLVLEDDSQCSATHCCDIVPHNWEHPSVDVSRN